MLFDEFYSSFVPVRIPTVSHVELLFFSHPDDGTDALVKK